MVHLCYFTDHLIYVWIDCTSNPLVKGFIEENTQVLTNIVAYFRQELLHAVPLPKIEI